MIRRAKVKPLPNLPMRLIIQTPWGKECSSQFAPGGVEWRFDVIHDGQEAYIYLPAEAKEMIHALRPNAGDVIDLTQIKQTQNGPVKWTVVPGSAIAYPVPPQASNVRTLPPANHGYTNGYTNGATALAPAAQPAQPVATVHPMEELMARCLVAGYRANMRAYEKILADGGEIDPPTWEDARATGHSFFIERNRQGGGR